MNSASPAILPAELFGNPLTEAALHGITRALASVGRAFICLEPPFTQFLTMINEAGGEIYGCKATVDMFHLKKDDFRPEVDGATSVGQFYEKAAVGQIIFT